MAASPVLTPLTVSAVPLYPSFDLYPSSPLEQFPPPLPGHRRPLRERRDVTLNLKISTTGSSVHPTQGPWSPKGHLQPHRSNLPRRRVTKRRDYFEQPKVVEIAPHAQTPPVAGQLQVEDSCLQELIPGLFLAFAGDDLETHQPGHTAEKPYTHILNICYPDPSESDVHPNGRVVHVPGRRVQRMRLVLPASARAAESQRAGLGLTDHQLRVARDFLGQALPSAVASKPEQSEVRALITTPHRRPTDAMCAAGCYLAFASGKCVEHVLRYVDEEEDFLSIWKGEVSGYEAERAEKVARAWSWLSQIKVRR